MTVEKGSEITVEPPVTFTAGPRVLGSIPVGTLSNKPASDLYIPEGRS